MCEQRYIPLVRLGMKVRLGELSKAKQIDTKIRVGEGQTVLAEK